MSTDPQPQDMSPQEYAELVRDANDMISGLETGISRTGAVFVMASVVTITTLVFDMRPMADVVAVVAVVAFLAAVVLVITRISLGPAPEPLDDESAAVAEVAQVAERPATGSGPATPRNGVIPPK